MTRTIVSTHIFASDSSPGTKYQTLVYNDGTLSCDCKGWTRRVQGDGSRTCKHVREVEANLGLKKTFDPNRIKFRLPEKQLALAPKKSRVFTFEE